METWHDMRLELYFNFKYACTAHECEKLLLPKPHQPTAFIFTFWFAVKIPESALYDLS